MQTITYLEFLKDFVQNYNGPKLNIISMGCSSLAQLGMIPGSSKVFSSCKIIWDPKRQAYMKEEDKAVSMEVCDKAHWMEHLFDNSIYVFLTASLITSYKKRGEIHAWYKIVYPDKKQAYNHIQDLDQYEDYDELLAKDPEFFYHERVLQDEEISMRILSEIRDHYEEERIRNVK